jgi:hypothetical protein
MLLVRPCRQGLVSLLRQCGPVPDLNRMTVRPAAVQRRALPLRPALCPRAPGCPAAGTGTLRPAPSPGVRLAGEPPSDTRRQPGYVQGGGRGLLAEGGSAPSPSPAHPPQMPRHASATSTGRGRRAACGTNVALYSNTFMEQVAYLDASRASTTGHKGSTQALSLRGSPAHSPHPARRAHAHDACATPRPAPLAGGTRSKYSWRAAHGRCGPCGPRALHLGPAPDPPPHPPYPLTQHTTRTSLASPAAPRRP